MNRIRVVVVLLSVPLVVLGRGMWVARPSAEAYRPAPEQRATAIYDPTTIYDPSSDLLRDDDTATPKMDVLGNQIDDAVGDYRVDVRGDLYERHSPETEVSRLKPGIG